MAYAKNKKLDRRSLARAARPSRLVHKSRARSTLLPASPAGKLTLTIIVFAIFVVIFTTISAFFSSSSRLAKSELENLAKNYYETYFYPKIENPEVLARYEHTGLATLSLRQLLLNHPDSNLKTENVKKTCDEDETFIKFYPTPPYKKSDFTVEYTYSCNW